MTVVVLAELNEVLQAVPDLALQFADSVSLMSPNRSKTYLAGRALLQLSLKRFASVGLLPRIQNDVRGKPYFADKTLGLDFNLSHSGDFIALSLGRGMQGVDLEIPKMRRFFDGLKTKILSLEEQKALSLLDLKSQQNTFAAFWTLRESLLKASGYGLSELSKIKVSLSKRQVVYPTLGAKGKVWSLKPRLSALDVSLWLSVYINAINQQPQFYMFHRNVFKRLRLSYDFSFTLV